ncbi:serine/threonine-protein kinase [Streptomyces sp. WAC 06738]|uniref:protein kinase domain-containing protein n=1 Tax=Streptomyces sp. WAC 06738 TaxID=2203210 RepID=UPI0013E06884|nr:serine/threonine-protein kinase [Streptomyces sp. WAC 06738]
MTSDDPQRVGPYWLASRLGAGGQGVVYEAYDGAGARCVVKVLRTGSAADGFARSRFRKEAAAAQRVDSFCTARVLDADAEADPPYLVSELINGRDLETAVRDDGPVGGDALVRLATGIATALTAIHAASVVHRDLKPANVLLGPDGPRVIDFGIARTQDMSLTETGKLMGTPGYMAPEVLRGSRADGKSDVFAWGAVVLFAATGRAPFHGENLGEIVFRVAELEPDLGPLPERIRPLVGAALSKGPTARPTSSELLLGLLTGGPQGQAEHPAESLARGQAQATVSGASAPQDPGIHEPDTQYWPPAPQTAATALPAAELLARGARAAAYPAAPDGTGAAGTGALPEWGAVAERVFTALAPAVQAAAEELFLRLVVPGDAPDGSQDGVRTASYAELLDGRPAHEKAALQQALDAFAAAGILIRTPAPDTTTLPLSASASGNATLPPAPAGTDLDPDLASAVASVRPVGAALHRAWPRLRALTAEHRDGLRVLRRTGDDARAWDRAGRSPDRLQHGGILRTALDQAATAPAALRPSHLERAFLAASRAHESRRKRQRNRLRGGIAVLLALALTAGGIAWQLQRTNAEQQALATARNVASVADGMRASDPETAALLSIAAWRIAPAEEARGALYQSAWQQETAVFQDPTKSPQGSTADMFRSLSEDGRVLVTEVRESETWELHRFDARTGRPLPAASGIRIGTLAPDGRFATGGDAVRDLGTGRSVGKVPGAGVPGDPGDRFVDALASGGERALTSGMGSQDTGFTVIDTRTGDPLLQVPDAQDASLTHDGRYLVSCPQGRDPVLYDIGSGGSQPLRGMKDGARCGATAMVSSSADSSRLAIFTGRYLSTWDTSTGKLLSTTWSSLAEEGKDEPTERTIMRMSPDGKFVAVMGNGAIDVSGSDDLGDTLLLHPEQSLGSLLEGALRPLAIDSEARALRYLDGNVVHTLDLSLPDLPRQATNDVGHYGPKAASLLTLNTVNGASRIRTWAVPAGTDAADPAAPPARGAVPRQTHDFPTAPYGHRGATGGETMQSALSPDGTTLAYSGPEPRTGKPYRLVLQDTHSGRIRRSVVLDAPDRGPVAALAFSKDGRTLAASRNASEDHPDWSTDIIDTATGRISRTLTDVGGSGTALGGSGDDFVLVTTSSDRVDLRTGRATRNALGNTDLYAVTFSPDGKTLAVSDPTGVALWNADATQRLGRMPGRAVTPLRFSPDGHSLAGVEDWEQLRLWDVPSRRPLGAALPGSGDILHDVAFDDRGNLHLAGRNIRSYAMPLDPDTLTTRICTRLNRPKNLTRAEWRQNIPDTPYRKLCD